MNETHAVEIEESKEFLLICKFPCLSADFMYILDESFTRNITHNVQKISTKHS